MKLNKGFKMILPMVLLAVIFIFGSQFMVNSLGSLDAHSNVSVAYQGQYNDTRDTTIVTISFTKYIPLILGAFGFIGVLMWISHKKKN